MYFSQSFYSLKTPNLFKILIQIVLGMYLDGIMAKEEEGFLSTTQGNFSQNKEINPKRFRHLDGGLGLHQGFQGFSYK